MKVNALSKKIGSKHVLANVSLTVEPGKITGIIGRNGAGKTTLLRLMVGILKPTGGDVLLNDRSVFTYPELKQDVVFVPDSIEALKNYTVKETVSLYQHIYPSFDEALLYQLSERFQLPIVGKVGSFSKGRKALFALILAFSTRASYILLDEPTDGLDVIVKKQLLRFIIEAVAENNVAVVISSHRLDELEFMADSIVMLKEGTVERSYSLEQLKQNYKKIQVVFPRGFPERLKENVTILQQTGKVSLLLIEGDVEKELETVKQYNPLFLEEIPVGLEDVFVSRLGGEDFAE